MTDAATASPARRAALWCGALMLGLLVHMSSGRAAAYLSAVEDMPLMPGLTEQKDSSFMFDAPDGRIVRAGARGQVASSDAAAFYKSSLPALGWTPTSARSGPKAGETRLTFAREGERLEIDVLAAKAGMTEVHFSIDPD
ncbi:MAG: hypothetical protein PW790_14135 [Parvibaculaceae bacterium]|nr:hypothetical protein [Parvibaculaceae bacterium]